MKLIKWVKLICQTPPVMLVTVTYALMVIHMIVLSAHKCSHWIKVPVFGALEVHSIIVSKHVLFVKILAWSAIILLLSVWYVCLDFKLFLYNQLGPDASIVKSIIVQCKLLYYIFSCPNFADCLSCKEGYMFQATT